MRKLVYLLMRKLVYLLTQQTDVAAYDLRAAVLDLSGIESAPMSQSRLG